MKHSCNLYLKNDEIPESTTRFSCMQILYSKQFLCSLDFFLSKYVVFLNLLLLLLFFCCVRQNISFNHVRNSQTAHNIDLLIIVAKKGFCNNISSNKLTVTFHNRPCQKSVSSRMKYNDLFTTFQIFSQTLFYVPYTLNHIY